MNSQKILIVEDEDHIAELIEFNLRKNGFECVRTDSAEKALAIFENGGSFDLILLDIMLTGMDGTEFCKAFRNRRNFRQIPIIMLTARSEEADIVNGLEIGADDYVTKPFSPRVLLARIRANLRENAQNGDGDSKLFFKDIELDREYHEVKFAGKRAELTANEFSILEMFLRARGRVFTRDTIIKNLHGDGYPVTDRAVDVSIVNLRKKMGRCAEFIETVRGVGYRFSRD